MALLRFGWRLVAACFVCVAVQAQFELFATEGTAFAPVGDRDGDGWADLAVQLPAPDAGVVRIVSSAHNSILLTITGDAGPNSTVKLAAAGDLDQDGAADLIVASPLSDLGGIDAGSVRIVSSVDGSTLRLLVGSAPNQQLGWRVVMIRDADFDGTPDYLVATRFIPPKQNADVILYSGATGALLRQWTSGPLDTSFGNRVFAPGDLDADGADDVAIFAAPVGWEDPSLRVYSSVSGALLREFPITDAARVLVAAGDRDGDGHGDVIVPSLYIDCTVRLVSGATGATLLELGDPAAESTTFLMGLGRADDIDKDGVGDFLLGLWAEHPEGSASVHVVSGASGDVLFKAYPTQSAPNLVGTSWPYWGESVDTIGDANGDGVPDFAVTGASQPVRVMSGMKSPWTLVFLSDFSLKNFLVGTTPLLPLKPVGLDSSKHTPGNRVFLIVGTSLLALPWKGGTLLPNPDLILGPFSADADGHVALSGTWPPGLPAGFSTWYQTWELTSSTPSGLKWSNGLHGVASDF